MIILCFICILCPSIFHISSFLTSIMETYYQCKICSWYQNFPQVPTFQNSFRQFFLKLSWPRLNTLLQNKHKCFLVTNVGLCCSIITTSDQWLTHKGLLPSSSHITMLHKLMAYKNLLASLVFQVFFISASFFPPTCTLCLPPPLWLFWDSGLSYILSRPYFNFNNKKLHKP